MILIVGMQLLTYFLFKWNGDCDSPGQYSWEGRSTSTFLSFVRVHFILANAMCVSFAIWCIKCYREKKKKPNITPTVQEHVKFAVQRDSYKVLVEVVALTWAMCPFESW